MEIRTCEEYVLKRLEIAEAEKERVEAELIAECEKVAKLEEEKARILKDFALLASYIEKEETPEGEVRYSAYLYPWNGRDKIESVTRIKNLLFDAGYDTFTKEK